MTARIARVSAPAKVNLALRIGGRRQDGFHDLETLFQAIDLADEVVVERAGSGVELVVLGADLGPVEENLAYRAAAAYADVAGVDGWRIRLSKEVPAGAGLGGGSSDAAAVLACCAALTDDADRERLGALGAALGSDVPFFLGESPLALATGRGEILTPLDPLPIRPLVVCTPPVHTSTAEAYARLAASREREGGGRSRQGLRAPTGWADVVQGAVNDFELQASEGSDEIAACLGALRSEGAAMVLLSGSGSASFGLFRDVAAAGRAARSLQERLGWPVRIARTLRTLPAPVVGSADRS